eukprot:gnl/Chilomastix_cuspidata/3727.p1 GENE.gnl/Chilomastix_cuspidata/3727~~gnl/Chilomastix_cuspidata/3727.p1  ORF type:complete len:736 (+),score=222.96 gnl/Chilomastix_cuspidata/3727:80-2209(+)
MKKETHPAPLLLRWLNSLNVGDRVDHDTCCEKLRDGLIISRLLKKLDPKIKLPGFFMNPKTATSMTTNLDIILVPIWQHSVSSSNMSTAHELVKSKTPTRWYGLLNEIFDAYVMRYIHSRFKEMATWWNAVLRPYGRALRLEERLFVGKRASDQTKTQKKILSRKPFASRGPYAKYMQRFLAEDFQGMTNVLCAIHSAGEACSRRGAPVDLSRVFFAPEAQEEFTHNILLAMAALRKLGVPLFFTPSEWPRRLSAEFRLYQVFLIFQELRGLEARGDELEALARASEPTPAPELKFAPFLGAEPGAPRRPLMPLGLVWADSERLSVYFLLHASLAAPDTRSYTNASELLREQFDEFAQNPACQALIASWGWAREAISEMEVARAPPAHEAAPELVSAPEPAPVSAHTSEEESEEPLSEVSVRSARPISLPKFEVTRADQRAARGESEQEVIFEKSSSEPQPSSTAESADTLEVETEFEKRMLALTSILNKRIDENASEPTPSAPASTRAARTSRAPPNPPAHAAPPGRPSPPPQRSTHGDTSWSDSNMQPEADPELFPADSASERAPPDGGHAFVFGGDLSFLVEGSLLVLGASRPEHVLVCLVGAENIGNGWQVSHEAFLAWYFISEAQASAEGEGIGHLGGEIALSEVGHLCLLDETIALVARDGRFRSYPRREILFMSENEEALSEVAYTLSALLRMKHEDLSTKR